MLKYVTKKKFFLGGLHQSRSVPDMMISMHDDLMKNESEWCFNSTKLTSLNRKSVLKILFYDFSVTNKIPNGSEDYSYDMSEENDYSSPKGYTKWVLKF